MIRRFGSDLASFKALNLKPGLNVLLADKSELESLEAASRSFLGWKRVQTTSGAVISSPKNGSAPGFRKAVLSSIDSAACSAASIRAA